MNPQKFHFSESALARHLGTSRWHLRQSGIAPSFRTGLQKIYSLEKSELSRLEEKFANENNTIIREFSEASPARQQEMARDPYVFEILKTSFRERLLEAEKNKKANH
jgi:hypothetical protein